MQVIHDRSDTRLRCVRAVGIRTAPIRRCTKGTAAITVFRVPVVGIGSRVGVLNLVDNTGVGCALRNFNIVGRGRWVTLAVAEPDRVAVAEHDVIGAGPAVHGLVEVVTHRIGIRQILEVRSVTVLDVIEAHGGRTFASDGGVGRILGAEGCRLLKAVCAGAHGYFHPWKQLCAAAGRIAGRRVINAAIQLLPHLVETVHRAGRVRVISESVSIRQLKRTGRERIHVFDTRIGNLTRQTRTAGHEVAIIVCREAVLGLHRQAEVVIRHIRVCGSAIDRGRKHGSGKRIRGWA